MELPHAVCIAGGTRKVYFPDACVFAILYVPSLGECGMKNFHEVFRLATGYGPYPYQERLATSIEWPQLLVGPAAPVNPMTRRHFRN